MSLSEEQSPDQMVAAEIWACLGRRRISANRAAQSLGWKQTYLSRRLTGSVSFSVPELYALAELLDVPVEQFFPPRPASEPRMGKATVPSSSVAALRRITPPSPLVIVSAA